MNPQTQKIILKTLVAAALVTATFATFATMAMDITNVQAEQEMAVHSQEKVQTMTQTMEKVQAITQIMEHTQAMAQSMEQAHNHANTQLAINTQNSVIISKEKTTTTAPTTKSSKTDALETKTAKN